LHTRFIELAGEINTSMPHYVMTKITDALNSRGKSVKGSKALVLGIAYKKNIDDMRESPSVEIMELLERHGAHVSYSDPLVPVFPKMRQHHFDLTSMELTPDRLALFDVIVLATNHDEFPYKMILEHAPLIVDTRGVFLEANPKVVKA